MSTARALERGRGGGPDALGRRVMWHALGLGGVAWAGFVIGTAAIVIAAAQQVVHDDSSGASGSETPGAVIALIVAVIAAALLTAAAAFGFGVVGVVDRVRGRSLRRVAHPIWAVVVSAPLVAAGVAAVIGVATS